MTRAVAHPSLQGIARAWLAAGVVLLVAGCASFDRSGTADSLSQAASLTRSLIRTDTFILTAFARTRDPAAPLVVYIEGDGLAWLSRFEPSMDPTPIHPIGLQLAATDPSPDLLYLARPCQYTPLDLDLRCNTDYWTDKRFAEEVIVAVNQAIDRFATGRGVRLVGYSGGAAVAALVAARRKDVIDIRTVAGNLDHVALHSFHHVSQLKGSLNPADVANRLIAVPQLHLIGGRDEVVVPQVAESYAARAGDRRCIEIMRIASATHEDGWVETWKSALRVTPRCRN